LIVSYSDFVFLVSHDGEYSIRSATYTGKTVRKRTGPVPKG
jgi:hypothetical protein